MIENPKSKLDLRFGLSIQFSHFNPNPKLHNYSIKKLKFHSASCFNNEVTLLFSVHQHFQTINLSVRVYVDNRCLLEIPKFCHKTWPLNICYPLSFSKDCWIVIRFGLDYQSILKIGFEFGLSITNLWWIWIGLTIKKNQIEKWPTYNIGHLFLTELILGNCNWWLCRCVGKAVPSKLCALGQP